MKRCPNCNRTYENDKQKFCTKDGGLLVAVEVGLETVLMDTQQPADDETTKEISRKLVAEVIEEVEEEEDEFDPFKTVMSRPPKATPKEPRETVNLAPSATKSEPLPQPSSAKPPAAPQQPTLDLTGRGPTSTFSSLPPPPLTQTPAQPSAAPRPGKKSRLPLVLGILAVLFLLGVGVIGAAYIFVIAPMLASRRVVDPPPPPVTEPAPNVDNPGNSDKPTRPEPPAYSPPADAIEFVNSKTKLDGRLAEHYVDFSFYYPQRWERDPAAGVPGASNFVKVERRLPPSFTQENFAVGWYSSAGSAEADRSVFPTLAEKLGKQFEKGFPGYTKVSEGETRVGVYDAYELRFEALSRNTEKGDVKLWGRLIFLPPNDGSKNGVTLLMLATSLAPELKTVADVGRKGELPMMLESFRFGKK